MTRCTPRLTRAATHFPYTTLMRAGFRARGVGPAPGAPCRLPRLPAGPGHGGSEACHPAGSAAHRSAARQPLQAARGAVRARPAIRSSEWRWCSMVLAIQYEELYYIAENAALAQH